MQIKDNNALIQSDYVTLLFTTLKLFFYKINWTIMLFILSHQINIPNIHNVNI